MALPVSAATYQVSIDTAYLPGTNGCLDVGFAGLADSLAATSFVHALSGEFALGVPLLDGAAPADPQGWRLGNDSAFNAVFQSWQSVAVCSSPSISVVLGKPRRAATATPSL